MLRKYGLFRAGMRNLLLWVDCPLQRLDYVWCLTDHQLVIRAIALLLHSVLLLNQLLILEVLLVLYYGIFFVVNRANISPLPIHPDIPLHHRRLFLRHRLPTHHDTTTPTTDNPGAVLGGVAAA